MSPSDLKVHFESRLTRSRRYSSSDYARGESPLESMGLEDPRNAKKVFRDLQRILTVVRPPGVFWGRFYKDAKEDWRREVYLISHYVSGTVAPVARYSLGDKPDENEIFSGEPVQKVLGALCKVFPEFQSFRDKLGNEDVGEQFREALGIVSASRGVGSVETNAEVLETFEGFVESIDEDTAYLRFTADNGDILYGQHSASELTEKGIHERRRFRCVVRKDSDGIHVDLESIPDKELSDERVREIWDEIERTVGTEEWDDAD